MTLSLSNNWVVVLFSAILLTACNDTNQTPRNGVPLPPPATPSGEITGAAFDSGLAASTVNVYDWSEGKKGILLSTTTTFGGGFFTAKLKQIKSTPILLEVTGGFYTEEASEETIYLASAATQRLLALAHYTEGESLKASITPMTMLAVGLAEYQLSQGETATNAIIGANDELSRWLGFDIISTLPINATYLSNASTVLTDEHKYGFISAGLSFLTSTFRDSPGEEGHKKYYSISMAQQGYNDIKADGALNGLKETGSPVALGEFTFGLDTYRGQLAARILQFAGGAQFNYLDRNKTGLGISELTPFALRLASDTGVLFEGTAATDIYSTSPLVTGFLPKIGQVVSGTWPVDAIVSDVYGVASVKYYVDGTYIAGSGAKVWGMRIPKTWQSIVTTNFTNGFHSFEIRVTNILGKITSVTHVVEVKN